MRNVIWCRPVLYANKQMELGDGCKKRRKGTSKFVALQILPHNFFKKIELTKVTIVAPNSLKRIV